MKFELQNHRGTHNNASHFAGRAAGNHARKEKAGVSNQNSVSLRRFAAVTFEQAAELLLATNVRERNGFVGNVNFGPAAFLRPQQQFILDPLVRTQPVIEALNRP